MARAPFRRKSGAREANQLVRLAEGLASSKSRAEDVYWERELEEAVVSHLENNDEDAINRALDRAHDASDNTFDALADMVESLTESLLLASETGPQRVTLFCAPILVWGRGKIPAKSIDRTQLQNIAVQLSAHVFSSKARIALVNHMFAPDQLPHTYSQSRELLQNLAESIRQRSHLTLPPDFPLEETPDVVCDMRMIVGAFQITEGEPLYAWQEMTTPVEEARQTCLSTWRAQGGAAIKPLLIGFPHELTLPRSFFAACRDADLSSRAFAIGASVAYIQAVTQLEPQDLTAVIGGCWGNGLEEYRIGFAVGDSEEVIHGTVWPLISDESDDSPVVEEIEGLLRKAGISRIVVLNEQLPLEFCDDCGSPHFPNTEGEMLHANLPEDAETGAVPIH